MTISTPVPMNWPSKPISFFNDRLFRRVVTLTSGPRPNQLNPSHLAGEFERLVLEGLSGAAGH